MGSGREPKSDLGLEGSAWGEGGNHQLITLSRGDAPGRGGGWLEKLSGGSSEANQSACALTWPPGSFSRGFLRWRGEKISLRKMLSGSNRRNCAHVGSKKQQDVFERPKSTREVKETE